MTEAFMAYPELRHPFQETPIHPKGSATVLYQGRTITLSEIGDGDKLLVNPEDLGRINGFEVKPEGACYEDMCIPLDDGLLVFVDGEQWFDLTGFADLLEQPWVVDRETGVWSFAEIPDVFVTARGGQVLNMSDMKGKIALIVTWSSW